MGENAFSNVIDVIGKVWDVIKGIANIPKKERAKYRDQFSDTLKLLEQAILLIHIRLRDLLGILREGNLDTLRNELYLLGDYDKWLQIERDVRLCRNLRITRREMDDIIEKFKQKISINDVDELHKNFDTIFSNEGELANFIASSLNQLTNQSNFNDNELKNVENQIISFKDKLNEERLKLINLEIKIIETT
ncbi:hypothetical protein LCGC14_3163990 [marine sediment metagenome]|uniref:Uncharacterized protein n=1 Tax=marine sediment metagenome TaxID=412755 RepID=A0A0F8VPU4_9ZZZZ